MAIQLLVACLLVRPSLGNYPIADKRRMYSLAPVQLFLTCNSLAFNLSGILGWPARYVAAKITRSSEYRG